jgi:hypothetical protein
LVVAVVAITTAILAVAAEVAVLLKVLRPLLR